MCAASPPCQGLSWAVRSALEVYGQDPAQFQAIQKRGMERDARCVWGGGERGGGHDAQHLRMMYVRVYVLPCVWPLLLQQEAKEACPLHVCCLPFTLDCTPVQCAAGT